MVSDLAAAAAGLARLFCLEAAPGTRVRRFLRPSAAGVARSRLIGTHRLEGKPEALGKLGSAVNALLEDLEKRGARLQDREQLFQRLVETVHDAVLVHRKSILFANTRFLAILGTTPTRSSASRSPISSRRNTSSWSRTIAAAARRRARGRALRGRTGRRARPGDARRVVEHRDRQRGPARAAAHGAGNAARGDGALAPLPPRAQATLDAMGESVITVDAEGRIDYINQAASALLGQPSTRSWARPLPTWRRWSTSPIGARSAIRCARRSRPAAASAWASARCWCRPTGPERSVEISVSPLRFDGNEIGGVVLVLHDTSELRGLTRQMTYQASHDALTGLVNRREFERRLQEALESAQAGDVTHALCYLDLDRFKAVNDTCGHTAGDNMLREVATLIKDAVRDSDTVGRIGGDEFALLLVGCPLDKARQIADDVVRSVNDYRFVWKDKIFNIGVSIGLVEIGRDGGVIEDIMNSADSACYVAKKQGGVHVHVYSAREEANARHQRRDSLAAETAGCAARQ
jgi:diguanylate cyclase (GGDEF)-like protein/PAS domain S-box-containing protein